ncbi:tRNA (adenosine(37)-N6)-threonylcarbamoyltransferase complex ATPase subunit type 1 TsaE [Mycoplasmopsis cynos]|nr:tRNA (adenosine(37)-N6)-threonylcarbamoyltransferase complex ATPase subunit type 1 TsaE [Mycoplasmopsis cynos]
MKKKEYKLNNESELDIIINDWIDDIRDVKIVLLNGELGSGKTTFVKKLAKNLELLKISLLLHSIIWKITMV